MKRGVQRQLLGLCGCLLLAHAAAEQQSPCYLQTQRLVQFLHLHADVVGANLLLWLSLVEVVAEDDALHQRHYLLQAL